PDGKAGIGQGFTFWQHTAIKQGTGDRRKLSRSDRARPLPSAPRARLHDLARAFQPVKATGLAKGTLPLGSLVGFDFVLRQGGV
ncbi:MAG: hypothetical protein DM484_28120, partial [Candidatus Methylumidiphilus alinenensis]